MNEFQNIFPWLRYVGPESANELENFNVAEFIQQIWNAPETNPVPPMAQNQPGAPAGASQGAPPASLKAIRRLPTICVKPEDLVDASNRECSICLEAISLGEKVTRLPCAHIFHQNCIVDWLTNHHCTCPVCRFELQTDNPAYEAGRIARMKKRKPRFAIYELKRMSVTELLALDRRPAPGVVDKDDLINLLIREERIEIIPSPEPVEYDIDTLQRMKISELRHTMEDAGVFFHDKDVVEKSDMLTIFLNSGRLSLRPTKSKEGEVKAESSVQSPIPCTNADCNGLNSSAKRPFVETVEEDSDNEAELKKSGKRCFSPSVEMFGSSSSTNLERHGSSNCLSNEANEDSIRMEADQEEDLVRDAAGNDSMIGLEGSANDSQTPSPEGIGKNESSPRRLDCAFGANQVYDESQGPTTGDQHENQHPDTAYALRDICPFQGYTVSHLRDLAKINNIDVSSCFERSDIVRMLTSARIEMKHPSEILRDSLSKFSVSELRIIASEVKVDLSQCSDKEDTLHCIVEESTVGRPYLQKYLRALSPLSSLSLAQLKKTARDWGVNINDCLERGEIIQRLITSGRTSRSS